MTGINQTAKRPAISADALAYTGTAAAVVSLLLAVFRLIVQTHVEGGYDAFTGLFGQLWWVYFGSFLVLSAFCFFACFAAIVVASIREG